MSHVMNTYARQPVAFVRGEGAWLWDEDGRKYLDGLAGIAVNTLGHNHPALVKAISEQAARIIHSSNLFRIPSQERAAELLAEISGLDEVFFCNSGLEANECAIKLARLYGHQRGIAEPHIVVMENAFHGRSLATLSATGSRKVQAGFEPLVPGFVRVPFNDLAAVRAVAEHDKNVSAVLIEPIQGEGGINVSRMDYLRGLHELCQKHEWLFISDEIQCGLGRTGKWFVYQHAGFLPDVVPMAKGVAGGVPMGACIAGGRAKGVFKPGNHGSTFGGGPLATAACVATLETMKKDGLLANAEKVGRLIRDELGAALAGVAGLREIRGMGLMIGVELDRPCGPIVKTALERGLVLNVTHENVIRLLPPLVMSESEGRQLVGILAPIVREFLAANAVQARTAPASAAAAAR